MKGDCPKWQKVLKENGGRMPAGHVNAYSKACDAFNKANGIKPQPPRAKKAHTKAMKHLEDADSEFSSDDSEAGFTTPVRAIRTRVHALKTSGTVIKNSFQVLDDGKSNDVTDEVIEQLNSWAHRVHRKPRKLAKKIEQRKRMDVLINDEAQLDAALQENSDLAARLPSETDRNRLMAMMSKAPSPDTLQPGEIFAMIDSGSGIDGADLSVIAPHIQVVPAAKPIICTTANGDQMVADKVARIRVALDGEECEIPFSDLPLEMPIISVRQHVGSRKHSCRIRDGGGYFRHTATKRKSRFIEKEGVYFMRMKILGQVGEPESSLFARQGVQA